MPESRNRHKHHHPPHTSHAHTTSPAKAKRSAAFVIAVIAAILGLAVAFFTQGADVFWLVIGTASGAIIGYLVGRSMDKSIAKS